ncbi:hypothetical protein BC833DRAFT_180357 [Globomyces pollinis-pini]|nr:hypothetical protein BC833DRAFT_180357 [Globomyces pollinis-pini]
MAISTFFLSGDWIEPVHQTEWDGFSKAKQRGLGRVAVMVVGGTRTFSSKSVHKSLATYIQSLTNQPEYFFQLTKSDEEDCKTMYIKYPEFSDEVALTYFNDTTKHISWENPSCDEPNIKKSSCCGRKSNPWHWISYMRKISAYNHVRDYEIQQGFEYDWYIFIRPDLYFFEKSIFTLSSLNKNRIYISSKEKDQPLGDYIYLVPKQYIKIFISSITHHNDRACSEGKEPIWSPEFLLDPYIHRHQQLPHQMLPILFAIARCNGKADCSRLDNEVLYNLDLLKDGKFVSPKDYCEQVFESNILQFVPS